MASKNNPEKNKNLLFDKFEILDCLKKDDYSAVYLANHIYLGKKILLKSLDGSVITDTTVLQRFKREAKILAKIEHTNIIKVLDFGNFKDFFYISFEYFESRNLRLLFSDKNIPLERKIALFIQLLKGLEAAHRSNIIHRDIKPENILVDARDHLKIADFGLAIVLNESVLTNTAAIVGTPGYMSPEQIRGETLNKQSDLFSTGIVGFELFYRKNPFLGKDINTTINTILTFDEQVLFKQAAPIPEFIRQSLSKLLQKNLSKRAQSAADVLILLGEKETDISVVSEKTSALTPFRLFAYSTVLLAVLGFIFYNLSYRTDSDSPLSEARIATDTISRISNTQENMHPSGDQQFSMDLRDDSKEPVSASTPAMIKSPETGQLLVITVPDVDVFIDTQKVVNTASDNLIQLAPGRYALSLIHPQYPAYDRSVLIEKNKVSTIHVDMDTLFGYFNCNVFPWGEVYLNGKYLGQTPFLHPVKTGAGTYILKIINPEFDILLDSLKIARKETTLYQVNLEKEQNRMD